MKHYLVTGGAGFLGSALVQRLLRLGHRVRVFDNHLRGHLRRLAPVEGQYEFVEGDIRDPEAVINAAAGVDAICHLAFVNGTEYFYSKPDLVLEVGVKGIMNVADACLRHEIGELLLISSSEVYQEPPIFPTPERVPMVIPDPLNPRYSYAAGKIISEIVALNYGRTGRLGRVLIVRPHNVYGPDMGDEHVIPQFVRRMQQVCGDTPSGPIPFPIQGTGEQTRAFVYVEDFTDGLMIVLEKGEHQGIYHLGTSDEVTVTELARRVGEFFGREVEVLPGSPAVGACERRCPDIARAATLGYSPKFSLHDGLQMTARWYVENDAPAAEKEKKENKWLVGTV